MTRMEYALWAGSHRHFHLDKSIFKPAGWQMSPIPNLSTMSRFVTWIFLAGCSNGLRWFKMVWYPILSIPFIAAMDMVQHPSYCVSGVTPPYISDGLVCFWMRAKYLKKIGLPLVGGKIKSDFRKKEKNICVIIQILKTDTSYCFIIIVVIVWLICKTKYIFGSCSSIVPLSLKRRSWPKSHAPMDWLIPSSNLIILTKQLKMESTNSIWFSERVTNFHIKLYSVHLGLSSLLWICFWNLNWKSIWILHSSPLW